MSEQRAQAGAIERWQLPEVNGPVVGVGDARRRQDALVRSLEQAEARGYEHGMSRAQAEMRARLGALDERIKRMDEVLGALVKPVDRLDGEVERELVQLALSVGRQLARRELKAEPAQVIAIVRESLGQLPAAARGVCVHLHPEDAAVVRERLSAPGTERLWTLVEDPTLSRGGCLVQSEASRIDARFESRVAAIAANALGDGRDREREEP